MEAGFPIGIQQQFCRGNRDHYWIPKSQDSLLNRRHTFSVERLGKNLEHIYRGQKEKWKKFIQNNDLISSCISCAGLGFFFVT